MPDFVCSHGIQIQHLGRRHLSEDGQTALFSQSTEMENVPDEILCKIFDLLPVADLCCCERYVSWYFVFVRLSFSIYLSFPLTSLFFSSLHAVMRIT